MITRRELLVLASSVIPVCGRQRGPVSDGHLTVKLKAPTLKIQPGEQALGLGGATGRDGLLIVPRGYRPETPAPLAVMLHGAGGTARRVTSLFTAANDFGVIILAPESRDRTWDGIRGRLGPDIEFMDRALDYTFERCAVDRRRLAIGGFSDGATYALSVGLASTDLFTHILACSPGFIIPSEAHSARPPARPKIFISHGTADEILPIADTSRRIVPALERIGYSIMYREFEGPHAVPPTVARELFQWFTH
jgi:predicted esterase